MIGKSAKAGTEPFQKTETTFANFKFKLLNTMNADRRLNGACIKVALSYLNHCNEPSKRVFKSIPDLIVETGLSEDTIRNARAKLLEWGYFEKAGTTEKGVPMFSIRNPNWSAVNDAKLARGQIVQTIAARKKARYRANIARKYGNPADLSPSKPEGPQNDVPPNSPEMSPSVFKGKYGSPSTECIGIEGDEPIGGVISDDWYTSEELGAMNANSNRPSHAYGDDDEATFAPPEDEETAKAMMAAIVEHFEGAGYRLSSFTLATLEKMYRRGVLSVSNARQIVENSNKRGANAAA